MFRLLLPVALLGLSVNAEPGQVVVFTLLLGGKRPRIDAYAFFAGWFVSLGVCFALASTFVRILPTNLAPGESRPIAVIQLLLVPVLVWFAVHEWRRRNRPHPDSTPKVLERLDDVGPRAAFVAGIYEQSWTITVAAGMLVVRAQASPVEATTAAVVFGITSSLTLIAAYLFFEIRGVHAIDRLKSIERRVFNVGPRVIAGAATVTALAFLVDGIYTLVTH